MKKIIFFVLSTIFVLIIPNVVDAASYAEFQTHSFTWTNNLDQRIWFSSSPTFNNFDGFVSFSFLIEGDYGLRSVGVPYEIRLGTSESISVCTMSSVAFSSEDVSSSNNDGAMLVSVSCPVSITNGTLAYVRFFRASYSNVQDITVRLPVGVMAYSGAEGSNIVNSVNDVNTSINNDSISSSSENYAQANLWASANASDTVVSDMVLMPITLLSAFSNGFNGSCQAYNLGSLYGTNLTLPCINIQNYLGASLWGIIDVLMSGFLIYGIGKKFVRVFNDFTNLKDSQVDELYGGDN